MKCDWVCVCVRGVVVIFLFNISSFERLVFSVFPGREEPEWSVRVTMGGTVS
jgi:hypothetical protein